MHKVKVQVSYSYRVEKHRIDMCQPKCDPNEKTSLTPYTFLPVSLQPPFTAADRPNDLEAVWWHRLHEFR